MPAAGPSMKNNVFMGAGQLGLENNVSKVLTWTARVEKQCFYGSRQLESLENNVSKVLTWTRVLKNNVFLGSIEDLKPEKHCLQAKK